MFIWKQLLNFIEWLQTYGAEEDKTLGIENEDAGNIIAARNFVGWYNGHPRDRNLKVKIHTNLQYNINLQLVFNYFKTIYISFQVDLSGCTAAILGQGNVALDVARILLSPLDQLKNTDITEYALQELANSKIKDLYLVGRRGPLHVAFTIKELREQVKLKNCTTVWRKEDFVGVEDAVTKLQRPRKRLTELMLSSLQESTLQSNNNYPIFRPIFYRSPLKFLINKQRSLVGIELSCNKLIGDSIEEQKCIATEETELLNCSLAFRSIGYKSIKVDDDLNFCNGVVANDKGRIIDNKGSDEARLYVAGWLGTGPVGVILHTMSNAFQVAKIMSQDLQESEQNCTKGGFEQLKKDVLKTRSPVVDWNGWEKIDAYEIEQGKKLGKPREKLTTIEKMIEVAMS